MSPCSTAIAAYEASASHGDTAAPALSFAAALQALVPARGPGEDASSAAERPALASSPAGPTGEGFSRAAQRAVPGERRLHSDAQVRCS